MQEQEYNSAIQDFEFNLEDRKAKDNGQLSLFDL
jgi:hypothetical protein